MPTNEDYFENSPGKDAPMGDDEHAEGEGKEGGDEQTYLVQKEAYPDAKPGDTFKMRVVRVHDEEMECAVEKGDEQSEDEEAAPDEAPMPANAGGGDSMYD